MLNQLRSAGENLRTSIDNYLGLCSSLPDSFSQGVPRELSAYLEQEFALILPYEQKMQQARIAICHAHNCCTSLTPINKLPSEILTRIFHLALENPANPPSYSIDTCPKRTGYPDRLAQVCSRWRTITLTSPTLWSHIDLTGNQISSGWFGDLVDTYTKRVGEVPYEIHVHDGEKHTADSHLRVERVISSLAYRSKALEFTITSPELQSFHSHVFQGLISNCNPEIFKTLRVHSHNPFYSSFIKAHRRSFCGTTSRYEDLTLKIHRSDSQIDDSLAGVTVLHLHGLYFGWSSQLYHGLVDLRLTSPLGCRDANIFTSDLRSILLSSPKLKILHFSLNLRFIESSEDSDTDDHTFDPVPLQDLEEVYVSTIHARGDDTSTYDFGPWRRRNPPFHVGIFLRLLAPGSKPLRLTLETTSNNDVPLFGSDGTTQFLARSNVEKLWVKGVPSMAELQRCHLPDLKVLVLDSCQMRDRNAFRAARGSCTWVVRNATLRRLEINWLTEFCPARLVFSQLEVLVGDKRKEIIPNERLRADFPTAEFLDVNLDFVNIADWDVLDYHTISKD